MGRGGNNTGLVVLRARITAHKSFSDPAGCFCFNSSRRGALGWGQTVYLASVPSSRCLINEGAERWPGCTLITHKDTEWQRTFLRSALKKAAGKLRRRGNIFQSISGTTCRAFQFVTVAVAQAWKWLFDECRNTVCVQVAAAAIDCSLAASQICKRILMLC